MNEEQINCVKYPERYEARLKSLLVQMPSAREYQKGSISATLGLSYTALKAQDPGGAAFLAFCGCLDNSKIHWDQFHWGYLPEETFLFRPVSAPMSPWIEGLATDWFQKIQDDEGQYDNTIRCLLNFSFVRRDAESCGVFVYLIVHRCLLSLSDLEVQ